MDKTALEHFRMKTLNFLIDKDNLYDPIKRRNLVTKIANCFLDEDYQGIYSALLAVDINCISSALYANTCYELAEELASICPSVITQKKD